MVDEIKRRRQVDRDADVILCALLAEIETFGELPEIVARGPEPHVVAMRSIGVPYRPSAWFSEPLTPARHKAYSRATERLECAGLVCRITGEKGQRVSRVQLTPAGLDRAIELAGPSADRTAVAEGLRRTAWGRELVAALPAGGRRQSPNP
jgi:hypothetical protein